MLLVYRPRDLVNRLVVREGTTGWTVIWYDDSGNEMGRAGYADAIDQDEAEANFKADHADFDIGNYDLVWYGPLDDIPPPGTNQNRI